jgi:hypothetical protein
LSAIANTIKMKNYKQSFDTLPILKGKGCVASRAGVAEIIVGLAEHVDWFALPTLVVEPVVALDARVGSIIGVAVLHLELGIHL